MPTPRPPLSTAARLGWWGGLLVVAGLALLPWWRNHTYLRDFYDYGLVMAGNARIEAGEKPYVDFVTPIQTAMFVLNRGAERLGGNTFVGMTRGAAVFIVVGVFLLAGLLARRFGRVAALLVAGAIVAGSASQHTIIWHNALGVLLLALVTWSVAIAPVWRRETIGWHLLTAVGLFVGGANKLNFHLVACAMAVGWVLHALIVRREQPWRGFVLLGGVPLFGAVLPVVAEMAWTGASFAQWRYNVIQLPFSSRASTLSHLASWRFYFETVHIYYGTLRLPPAGAIGVLLAAVAAFAGARGAAPERRGWAWTFAAGAGLLAAVAGAALLATNNEIAYVMLAAALVLAASLWLGFGAPTRGPWFAVGLLVPSLVVGVCAWESAWRGQRSQFGHSNDPRAQYELGETAGADFGYLRGLHLPGSYLGSLKSIVNWRNELSAADRTASYYGPASEWLERIWPVTKVRELPLWMHVGTSFGEREADALVRALRPGGSYHHLLVPEPWDHWGDRVDAELKRSFMKVRIGPLWFAYHALPHGVFSTEPLGASVGFGGNLDSTRVVSAMPRHQLPDGRQFLGIDEGTGEMQVRAPSFRASGEVVLQRLGTSGTLGPVRFQVLGLADGQRIERVSLEVSLPEDQNVMIVPCKLDSSGLPLAYVVTVPPELSGNIRAGWRAPAFSHAGNEDTPLPPQLITGSSLPRDTTPEERAALLPPEFQNLRVVVKNAWVDGGRLRVSPGGEVWVKLPALYPHITLAAASWQPVTGPANPVLRAVFYKSGRLETLSHTVLPDPNLQKIPVWSPEGGGWIGLLDVSDRTTTDITVRVEALIPP